MASTHFYSVILSQHDPQHPQPEKILIPLKPHQCAGLYKAKKMEQEECISYHVSNPRSLIPYGQNQNPNIFGYFQLKTNIGVIGDIVGFGKTLLALSIIAELPKESINIPDFKRYTYHNSYGYLEIMKENTNRSFLSNLIKTTLVVVPRGPVYVQWKNTIKKDTKLTYLAIDNLPYIKKHLPNTIHELKTYLEKFDVVLIKNTTLQTLVDHYKETDPQNEMYGFDRIMIDEAHMIIIKIPDFNYKFLWLITSSYRELFFYNYSKTLYSGFLQMIQHSVERLHYILVKGDPDFVRSSFNVPPPVEHYYVCKMNKTLSAIQPFLTASIQEKINVNDISGAIHELGGAAETEEALIEAVITEVNKDISNKEKEIGFVRTLEIDQETKENRIKNLEQELQRSINRRTSIKERLQEVTTRMCSICHDALENPIYLNCSHIFCGQCILTWMQSNIRTRSCTVHCPECRTTIDSTKIVAIVKEKTETQILPIFLSKEDQMLDIIQKKPNGRFLLFSRMDTTFGRLSMILGKNNISHCEIKGSTQHMMNILEDFEQNKIRVILLNTYHAGCGIDISSATDVIIYHSMPLEKIQAVGRAQRVGRTEPLTIHNLCYPHEMSHEN
jgi:SNF2 family DNA or RNA helicase